jgi:hypothetical protein
MTDLTEKKKNSAPGHTGSLCKEWMEGNNNCKSKIISMTVGR